MLSGSQKIIFFVGRPVGELALDTILHPETDIRREVGAMFVTAG